MVENLMNIGIYGFYQHKDPTQIILHKSWLILRKLSAACMGDMILEEI